MWSAIAGAVGGAAGNAAGSALNAGIQYATSKSLAKYNYELGQRSLEYSPGNYKKGLIKAGINPILASNSPVGSTSGSSGVNPGMDLTEGAVKGVSARNQYKQTESNIQLQGKQGNAITKQAGAAETSAKASETQAEAAKLNAETEAKKVDAEIRGIDSTVSLNEVKKVTEEALQGKHYSEEMKNNVASLAQWVASEMDRAQLDYWKRHPDQFDKYMEETLKAPGNVNSARNWKKYTDAANTILNVADTIMDAIPSKKPTIGVKRGPTKYAPGF